MEPVDDMVGDMEPVDDVVGVMEPVGDIEPDAVADGDWEMEGDAVLVPDRDSEGDGVEQAEPVMGTAEGEAGKAPDATVTL